MAGTLWNLTHVVRAGRYFVWRLLRLTVLRDERTPMNQHSVRLGRGFHTDLLWWKRAINRKLVQGKEGNECVLLHRAKPTGQSALTYPMPVSKRSVGTASRKRLTLRYGLSPAQTADTKRKAERRETCTIATNLLELLGMVVTAWVLLDLTGDSTCVGRRSDRDTWRSRDRRRVGS